MTLTLPALHRLALKWCPEPARWDAIMRDRHWGPAHEIGHALVSRPDERTRPSYGLTRRPWSHQARHEIAAMHIGAHLLTAAGRRDLIEREREHTPFLADMEAIAGESAHRLLERMDLIDLPRTVAGLERLLRRRLA